MALPLTSGPPPTARKIAATLFCALLLACTATEARAQALRGSVVIEPQPDGDTKPDTVTFELPRKVMIAGTNYVMPNQALVGEHTCTLDPAAVESEATDGHHIFYARFNRGTKLGSVFRGRLTAGAGTLLFEAGCDGNPETEDAFQGDATALFAEVAVFVTQVLEANEFHADGKTVREEIREAFHIADDRFLKLSKIGEFHGFEMLNRGGSASGRASARIRLVFKP